MSKESEKDDKVEKEYEKRKQEVASGERRRRLMREAAKDYKWARKEKRSSGRD